MSDLIMSETGAAVAALSVRVDDVEDHQEDHEGRIRVVENRDPGGTHAARIRALEDRDLRRTVLRSLIGGLAALIGAILGAIANARWMVVP
jgi:hypothetical protein